MPSTVTCATCQRELRVPDEYLGKRVKCPACGAVFTPTADGHSPEASRTTTSDPGTAATPSTTAKTGTESEFFFEDDDIPPDKRRRRRMDLNPHRGTLIIVLGALSVVACGPFGPVAWIMGNADLKEIRAGRMDPDGESLTNTGKVLGIIGTILFVLGCVGCGGFLGLHGIAWLWSF
jgi:hypothetical protein